METLRNLGPDEPLHSDAPPTFRHTPNMTADDAILFSYLLGLVALAVDTWRARGLARLARERIVEEAGNP